MLRCLILVITLCLFTNDSNAQESNKALGTSFGINRFDFFHKLEFDYTIKGFTLNSGIGYGINRTIFQRRLFPMLSVGATYNFKLGKMKIGPAFNFQHSWVKYYKEEGDFHQYDEIYLGIRWRYGNKWSVGQQLLIGYMNEHFVSGITNEPTNAGGFGYFGNLGLYYAF